MRQKITIFCMAVFFGSLVVAVLSINFKRPSVLVLHSYDSSYTWTREVNVGLKRELEKDRWILVRYHYMDTKRNSGKDSLRRAGIAARDLIRDKRPDIIIAIDDYAQSLVASTFVNDPDIQIVFAGVNGSAEPYGYIGAKNVTGIYERKPIAALKEILMILAPGATEHTHTGHTVSATFIADKSLSSMKDSELMTKHDWSPITFEKPRHVSDFESWKKAILAAEKRSDFVLPGGYRKLKRRPDSGPNEKFVPPKEVMNWTENNSPVPVIGTSIFHSEEGAMVSVGVSPYEQGGVAAKMAQRIIQENLKAGQIPIQTSNLYIVSYKRSALERRKLKIPKIFEAFARATNNHFD
ncbi:MAG: hypothetical protein GKS01_19130 [Alphaproteobacteria bacterium]|nr:hypothetical protein [Alphaproteobacteria bacterium]